MLAASRAAMRPRSLQTLSQLAGWHAAPFSTHIGTSNPAPKALNDIMKLEELQGHTAEDVEQIWMQARPAASHEALLLSDIGSVSS